MNLLKFRDELHRRGFTHAGVDPRRAVRRHRHLRRRRPGLHAAGAPGRRQGLRRAGGRRGRASPSTPRSPTRCSSTSCPAASASSPAWTKPPIVFSGALIPEFPDKQPGSRPAPQARSRPGDNDDFFIVFGPEEDCRTAVEEIRLRFVDAIDGRAQGDAAGAGRRLHDLRAHPARPRPHVSRHRLAADAHHRGARGRASRRGCSPRPGSASSATCAGACREETVRLPHPPRRRRDRRRRGREDRRRRPDGRHRDRPAGEGPEAGRHPHGAAGRGRVGAGLRSASPAAGFRARPFRAVATRMAKDGLSADAACAADRHRAGRARGVDRRARPTVARRLLHGEGRLARSAAAVPRRARDGEAEGARPRPKTWPPTSPSSSRRWSDDPPPQRTHRPFPGLPRPGRATLMDRFEIGVWSEVEITNDRGLRLHGRRAAPQRDLRRVPHRRQALQRLQRGRGRGPHRLGHGDSATARPSTRFPRRRSRSTRARRTSRCWAPAARSPRGSTTAPAR